MFTRWGDLVYRFRFAVIAVVGAAMLALGAYGTGLGDRVTQSGWFDPGSESVQGAELADASFGRDHLADVIVMYNAPEGGTIDDPEFRDKIVANLTSALAANPDHIDKVNGAYWPVGDAPAVPSAFGSKDKKHAFASIAIVGDDDTTIMNNYRAVQGVFDIPGVDVEVSGLQPIAFTLADTLTHDQKRMELLAIPAVAVLLFFIFGGIVAAALPLIIGGLTILGATGIVMALTNFTEVNSFVGGVVSMIGLGLAIDYGLFIVSRFREELAEGYDTPAAVRRSVVTAGRTVIFSATMIIASLGGVLLFPQAFLRSVAYGTIASVSLAALTAVTILPAMLAVLGPRVDMLGLKWFRKTKSAEQIENGFWGNLTRWVMRHPLKIAIPVTIGLLLLIIPVKNLAFGGINEKYLPPDNETRVALEHFYEVFPQSKTDPIQLVFVTENTQAIGQILKDANQAPGLVSPFEVPSRSPNDPEVFRTSTTLVDPTGDVAPTIDHLRSIEMPDDVTMYVTGQPALMADSIDTLLELMPWMILIVLISTFVLMFLTFGSLVLPIKAALMSALGLGSTLGILTWIFTDGHGAGILNFTPQPISAPVLMLIIAIIYGLSTDYEVFLLSRMVEARAQGASTTEAVRIGTAQTGRIITAAALILLVVTGAFAFSDMVMMQYIAYGMIAALIIDATVLRMLLVPAIMKLLGDDCWWAPKWMKRIQEKIGLGEPILDDERPQKGTVVDLVKTTPITDPPTMQMTAVPDSKLAKTPRRPRTVAEIEAEAPTQRMDKISESGEEPARPRLPMSPDPTRPRASMLSGEPTRVLPVVKPGTDPSTPDTPAPKTPGDTGFHLGANPKDPSAENPGGPPQPGSSNPDGDNGFQPPTNKFRAPGDETSGTPNKGTSNGFHTQPTFGEANPGNGFRAPGSTDPGDTPGTGPGAPGDTAPGAGDSPRAPGSPGTSRFGDGTSGDSFRAPGSTGDTPFGAPGSPRPNPPASNGFRAPGSAGSDTGRDFGGSTAGDSFRAPGSSADTSFGTSDPNPLGGNGFHSPGDAGSRPSTGRGFDGFGDDGFRAPGSTPGGPGGGFLFGASDTGSGVGAPGDIVPGPGDGIRTPGTGSNTSSDLRDDAPGGSFGAPGNARPGGVDESPFGVSGMGRNPSGGDGFLSSSDAFRAPDSADSGVPTLGGSNSFRAPGSFDDPSSQSSFGRGFGDADSGSGFGGTSLGSSGIGTFGSSDGNLGGGSEVSVPGGAGSLGGTRPSEGFRADDSSASDDSQDSGGDGVIGSTPSNVTSLRPRGSASARGEDRPSVGDTRDVEVPRISTPAPRGSERVQPPAGYTPPGRGDGSDVPRVSTPTPADDDGAVADPFPRPSVVTPIRPGIVNTPPPHGLPPQTPPSIVNTPPSMVTPPRPRPSEPPAGGTFSGFTPVPTPDHAPASPDDDSAGEPEPRPQVPPADLTAAPGAHRAESHEPAETEDPSARDIFGTPVPVEPQPTSPWGSGPVNGVLGEDTGPRFSPVTPDSAASAPASTDEPSAPAPHQDSPRPDIVRPQTAPPGFTAVPTESPTPPWYEETSTPLADSDDPNRTDWRPNSPAAQPNSTTWPGTTAATGAHASSGAPAPADPPSTAGTTDQTSTANPANLTGTPDPVAWPSATDRTSQPGHADYDDTPAWAPTEPSTSNGAGSDLADAPHPADRTGTSAPAAWPSATDPTAFSSATDQTSPSSTADSADYDSAPGWAPAEPFASSGVGSDPADAPHPADAASPADRSGTPDPTAFSGATDQTSLPGTADYGNAPSWAPDEPFASNGTGAGAVDSVDANGVDSVDRAGSADDSYPAAPADEPDATETDPAGSWAAPSGFTAVPNPVTPTEDNSEPTAPAANDQEAESNRNEIENWMAQLRSSRRGGNLDEGRHHGNDRTVSVNELLRRRESDD